MIGYADLRWKENKLYHGDEYVKIWIEKDKGFDFMYWLHWDFGKPDKSKNFYNLIGAHDNGKRIYLAHINGSAENGT